MRLMDSRSRISYASIVFIIALLVAENMTVPSSAVVAKDATSEKKEKKNDFLQRIERKKKELRRYLKKDGSWELTHSTRQLPKKTRRALKIIRELRSAEFVDLLVPRISFEQWPGRHMTRMERSVRRHRTYPVYYTVKKIGIPAIPPLMEALKDFPSEKESRKREQIIKTIVHIYKKAYAGHRDRYMLAARLAKTSLEAELEKTEDKKKRSRLQKALENSLITEYVKEEETKKE